MNSKLNHIGKFITFEGGEGAGKSTQIQLLKTALDLNGIDTIATREPGGSDGAEQIRRLLVEGDPDRWSPMSEALLNIAARNDHVERLIKPQLNAGSWVVCDRFFDSTKAYQGYGHGLERSTLDMLHNTVFGEFVPDLTLIFDLPVETGMARTVSRGGGEDRFEKMDRSFHERLRRGFLDIAHREPDRCHLINADQSVEVIAMDVKMVVGAKFNVEWL